MARDYSTILPDLYRGVIEDNEDDKHLGRCKIWVPSIHGDFDEENRGQLVESLPWALPMTTVSINKDRGSICIPDVGDYVWVMFEASDKNRPVYLGGFYAQADIPVDERTVTIYIDKENAITYNRDEEVYSVNVKNSTVTITEENISISSGSSVDVNQNSVDISGDTNITGEQDVTEDVYMHKDLHVDEIVYCKALVEMFSNDYPMDPSWFDNMTPEEIEAAMQEISDMGIDLGDIGLQNFMDIYINQGEVQALNGLKGLCNFSSYMMLAAYYSGKKFSNAELAQIAKDWCQSDGWFTQQGKCKSLYGFDVGGNISGFDKMQSTIVGSLKRGAPLILHCRGYWGDYHTTPNGHFMVIRGSNSEGIQVADPGKRANNTRTIPWSALKSTSNDLYVRTTWSTTP